jgi:hypothetical protein
MGFNSLLVEKLNHTPIEEIRWCTHCEKGRKERDRYMGTLAKLDQARIKTIFEEAGIPAHLKGLTLDMVPDELSQGKRIPRGAVRMYLAEDQFVPARLKEYDAHASRMVKRIHHPQSPRYALVLYGSVGTGKSAMIAMCFEHALRAGGTGLWIDYHEFLEQVQKTYDKSYDGPSADTIMSAAQVADIVVLDDLGDTNGQVYADRTKIIYRLVNIRHKYNRPTFVTTNLSPAGMASQFESRTWDRLRERAWVLEVGGVNLRNSML